MRPSKTPYPLFSTPFYSLLPTFSPRGRLASFSLKPINQSAQRSLCVSLLSLVLNALRLNNDAIPTCPSLIFPPCYPSARKMVWPFAQTPNPQHPTVLVTTKLVGYRKGRVVDEDSWRHQHEGARRTCFSSLRLVECGWRLKTDRRCFLCVRRLADVEETIPSTLQITGDECVPSASKLSPTGVERMRQALE